MIGFCKQNESGNSSVNNESVDEIFSKKVESENDWLHLSVSSESDQLGPMMIRGMRGGILPFTLLNFELILHTFCPNNLNRALFFFSHRIIIINKKVIQKIRSEKMFQQYCCVPSNK